jgi:HD-GYP domain-containing protein (c-di-GMP phosphodiesterase class II)
MSAKLKQFTTISLSRLRVGAILRAPIYDEASPVLLIAAGQQLSPSLLKKLAQRGVSNVRVSEQEVLRVTLAAGATAVTKLGRSAMPAKAESTSDAEDAPNAAKKDAFIHKLRNSAEPKPLAESTAAFNGSFQQSVADLGGVFSQLKQGEQINRTAVIDNVSATLQQIAVDFDLFILLAIQKQPQKYPFSHSLQVANLATAVGVILEFDESSLVDIGVGCMLHDLGMLKIAPDLLNCKRPLERIEKLDITKHPALTFNMIERICGISLGAKMVAYQMHERLDGSGYPRKRVASQIHPLAKVAMVADSFVAMTSPRPHRAAMLPYCAMQELIEQAKSGKYCPVSVRGLLHTVALFPVGSFVELSDGRVGKVVRSNREHFTQPVVEAWRRLAPLDVESVDLLKHAELTIIRALRPGRGGTIE